VSSRRLLTVIAAALIGAAGGVGALFAIARPAASPVSAGPYNGSTPPGHIVASDFQLRDYRGAPFSMRAQRGKAVLLSFVDSKCTDKCPIVTSVMAQAYARLPASQRREVVPVLITVSPDVDTPRSVRRFLARLHARALNYLLGSPRQLRPIWNAYGILSALDTGNADVHSSDVRVFDRDGVWVSTQHAGVDLTAANLAADAETALERS
jgi:protein SCO1/2